MSMPDTQPSASDAALPLSALLHGAAEDAQALFAGAHILFNLAWLLVEHSFRVLTRQFGYVKVRYRKLEKNTARLETL